jgi:hypothetical protein
MFRWYQKAKYCHAYVADVPDGTEVDSDASAFASSRWFTRGWTLQELLAPADLIFFSSGGQELGPKHDLTKELSKITSISEGYLNGTNLLAQASIAKRVSWAFYRETTRTEDIAYCLLGIFDINMPLLYGEGERAFVSLQEEIMKNSDDQSLFAWGLNESPLPFPPDERLPDFLESYGPFVSAPAAFENSGHIIPDVIEPPTTAFAITGDSR